MLFWMKMSSNSTSSQAIAKTCILTVPQQQMHVLAGEISFYLLALLGISYPLAVITAVLTALALFTIRSWRSSTRIYYYVITIANLVAAFSIDWQTFLIALNMWATRWFPDELHTVAMLHWELLWPPLCAIFNFVKEAVILPKLWVFILLWVHRMWIVLQPLRAPLLKRVFGPPLVIGLPVGLTLFITPQLWLSYIVNGTVL